MEKATCIVSRDSTDINTTSGDKKGDGHWTGPFPGLIGAGLGRYQRNGISYPQFVGRKWSIETRADTEGALSLRPEAQAIRPRDERSEIVANKSRTDSKRI